MKSVRLKQQEMTLGKCEESATETTMALYVGDDEE
jgi:hypothetical protein